jgi:transcription factor IIIB subunit 2
MIDFADILNTDIFTLSKIYLKLVRLVRFEVKHSDPSLYVPRFLKALKFPADQEKEILKYVINLLARMKMDWLGKGRRPSGLIAAGFYIACKCFKIEKSFKDIARVLKVSEETIRKRVNEFKNLKVAKLTKEDFEKLALTNKFEPEDPPSFKRSSMMALRKASEGNEIKAKPGNIKTFFLRKMS